MAEKKISEMSQGQIHTLVVEALSKAGYNPNQIAQLMGLSRQTTTRIKKKIEGGALDNLRVKARKTVEAILTGKLTKTIKVKEKQPDGTEIEVEKIVPAEVTPSEMLRAATMVLDRTDPATHKVEQKTEHHVSGTITHDERLRYMKALGISEAPALPDPKVVDAQFTEVPSGDTDKAVQALPSTDGENGHTAP